MNAINKLQDILNFLLSLVSSTSFETTPFPRQKNATDCGALAQGGCVGLGPGASGG
jgi:hypothetical protein